MQFSRPFTSEERIVTRFALFPMKINETIYWLEKIRIHQSYGTRGFGWCNDWVEDTEDEEVKVYKVYPKDNPDLWYLVDAPDKYIAKWCGTAILNNTYSGFLTAKDMKAERFKAGE